MKFLQSSFIFKKRIVILLKTLSLKSSYVLFLNNVDAILMQHIPVQNKEAQRPCSRHKPWSWTELVSCDHWNRSSEFLPLLAQHLELKYSCERVMDLSLMGLLADWMWVVPLKWNHCLNLGRMFHYDCSCEFLYLYARCKPQDEAMLDCACIMVWRRIQTKWYR